MKIDITNKDKEIRKEKDGWVVYMYEKVEIIFLYWPSAKVDCLTY